MWSTKKWRPVTEPRTVPEHRWPAAVAVLIVLALFTLLPSSFLPPLRYALVGVGIAALLPLIAVNPHRFGKQTRWSRTVSVGLALLLLLGNQVMIVLLIMELTRSEVQDGQAVLLSALQVWLTNAIVFALIFWEMDRGGPVLRNTTRRKDLPGADFRFPQDEDHDTSDEVRRRSSVVSGWRPAFMDYFFSSLSASMAFSATDAMPLSHRAKALLALESFSGFVILALVIARAVSILG